VASLAASGAGVVPLSTLESLLTINNALQQPEAAEGVLMYAQQHHNAKVLQSWNEKLLRWEAALAGYEQAQQLQPGNVDVILGRMRCLRALGEWERLQAISMEAWSSGDDATRVAVAPLAAAASWNLDRWELMPAFTTAMGKTVDGF